MVLLVKVSHLLILLKSMQLSEKSFFFFNSVSDPLRGLPVTYFEKVTKGEEEITRRSGLIHLYFVPQPHSLPTRSLSLRRQKKKREVSVRVAGRVAQPFPHCGETTASAT